MKWRQSLVGALLFAPLLAGPAHAGPADPWVENYTDEEAQTWYQSSQVSSGNSSQDESQNAVVTRSQRGPVFVEDSDSSDNSEVNGANTLPIVGNDVLGNAEVLNNTLNNYSQTDSSSTSITQSRSEDNDAVHTSVIEDSFNAAQRVPVVVLEPRPARVIRTSEGNLPVTGFNFSFPLALGLWFLVSGLWMVRMARSRAQSLELLAPV